MASTLATETQKEKMKGNIYRTMKQDNYHLEEHEKSEEINDWVSRNAFDKWISICYFVGAAVGLVLGFIAGKWFF